MRNFQVLFVALAGLSLAGPVFAAGSDVELMDADIDPGNIQSLQRGAANFMNYCSGCHSAKYVRYSTIGEDLELSDQQLIDNLMFNAEKTFETIRVAMPADAATGWFGVAPPDLSLTARSKGSDYIYSFLKGFYIDDEKPNGVNNLYLAGTAMPHVLWELQGFQRAIYEDHENPDGSETHKFVKFEQATAGTLDPEAYDGFVRDTVNFLTYIAEPVRMERQRLGVWVILFLTLFGILAYMLKKEIWRDVT